MQDHKDVPLGIRIDSATAHFIRLALYWLSTSLLVAAGLTGFALLPLFVFEYQEGLQDVSIHEWLFLVVMALLVWRYCIYCSRFDVPWGTRVSRILVFFGGFAVLQLVFWMALILSGVGTGRDLHSVLNEPKLNYILEGVFWLGATLTFYLASPSPKTLADEDIPVVHAESVPPQSHSKGQS